MCFRGGCVHCVATQAKLTRNKKQMNWINACVNLLNFGNTAPISSTDEDRQALRTKETETERRIRGQEKKKEQEKMKAERRVNLMGKDGRKTGGGGRNNKKIWRMKINGRIGYEQGTMLGRK